MRRPISVGLAAMLAGLYTFALLAFSGAAGWVFVRTLQGHAPRGGGDAGHAIAGMLMVTLLGLAGSGLLAVGAIRTWNGDYKLTRVPLAVVVVAGSIGEVVDLLGTATLASDLVGIGILIAAAVPLILLATRSARAFASSRRGLA